MRKRTTAVALCVLLLLASSLTGCTAEMKARAYASDDRDEWQQPERVVASLGIRPGQRVADLGAGGGYFTFRLAEAVGERGRIYAIDVDEAMNERLEGLVRERGVDNVRVVLATGGDPNIPEPVDLLFTSNTYHHIDDRVAYFERVGQSLRPGGRVAVLEYKKEGWFQRLHSTGSDDIRNEMQQAGYALLAEHDYLERQHFLIFGSSETSDSPALDEPDASEVTVTCSDPRSPMCTREYRPVCALRDTGIRCVTEPCPSWEWKTYSNACTACADAAVQGHRPGACDG